jgi:hypothetical protein
LFATQQRRRPFSFSYRSKIGSHIKGLDHGYKIHIVYNALAEPTSHSHKTLGEDNEAFNFSWNIKTRPPIVEGFRPTSHFVIDSRDTPEELLKLIEDMIYGTSEIDARLPSAGELAYLFTSYESSTIDAGHPLEAVFFTYDGGPPVQDQTSTLDGGTP